MTYAGLFEPPAAVHDPPGDGGANAFARARDDGNLVLKIPLHGDYSVSVLSC